MKGQEIRTVPQPISFLRRIGIEAIEKPEGWILYGISFDSGEFEITRDSDVELIDYARGQSDLLKTLLCTAGIDSLAGLPDYFSSSPYADCRDLLLAAYDYALIAENGSEEKSL